MEELIKVVTCANPLTLSFASKIDISNYKLCIFFSSCNIEFCQREVNKVGPLAEQIVREVLEFSDIRQVFLNTNNLIVVLKAGKNWETLPDQIIRIIEKTLEEFGISQ